ncbi:MAG: S9 family peptidase [Chloroflexi bacterium]|nr:S9 family peptidase [Chloroflexota bacterium]
MAAGKRHITAEDLFAMRIASDPQLSPDGSTVAFVVTTVDQKEDRYHAAIWTVSTRGGQPAPFTSGLWRDHSPRWSPDGTRLAFISDRSGTPQVWATTRAGGEAQQVTAVEHGVSEFAWSPDSSRIAIIAKVMEEEPRKGRSDARTITRLYYRTNDDGYFDGKRRHLFVAPAEGGVSRQLTSGQWDDSGPTWSPDGKAIAFASGRDDKEGYSRVTDIWAVAAEGGSLRRLTAGNALLASPAWSPDGRWLACVGHQVPLDWAATPGVWLIPAGGGEGRDLTAGLDRPVGVQPLGDVAPIYPAAAAPVWSPSGDTVFFSAADAGNTHVFSVTLEGQVQRLTQGDMVCRSFSLAADGKTLSYCATSPTNPADVYLATVGSGATRRLTYLNKALMEELDLTAPERISYRSTDGTPVEGWVLKPPGSKAGQRYPLALEVHGGPHALYGNVFMQELHLLAAQGYVVLFTNPRGSTGYGYPFAAAIRGEWGNKDYLDIMAGVDYLLGQGYVDEKRMAVMGGSYGGYMTLWVAGHTDRFAAAIADRALGDLALQYAISDPLGMLYMEADFGKPQESLERFWRCSPIAFYDKMKTPMLLIASENDFRCNIAQSEQAFTALRRQGIPAEFVRFPEENHGLSRAGKPSRRVDRLERMVDWLGRWLR